MIPDDATCPVCGDSVSPDGDVTGTGGKLYHTDCLEAFLAGEADVRGGDS